MNREVGWIKSFGTTKNFGFIISYLTGKEIFFRGEDWLSEHTIVPYLLVTFEPFVSNEKPRARGITPEPFVMGSVESFSMRKRFGYLRRDDGGPNAFLIPSEIRGTGKREEEIDLQPGTRVIFQIMETAKNPEARNVRLL